MRGAGRAEEATGRSTRGAAEAWDWIALYLARLPTRGTAYLAEERRCNPHTLAGCRGSLRPSALAGTGGVARPAGLPRCHPETATSHVLGGVPAPPTAFLTCSAHPDPDLAGLRAQPLSPPGSPPGSSPARRTDLQLLSARRQAAGPFVHRESEATPPSGAHQKDGSWCAPDSRARADSSGGCPPRVHFQETVRDRGAGSQQDLTPLLLTPVDLRRCRACWEGQ